MDDATTKRYAEALRDTKKAARAIIAAIEADNTETPEAVARRVYHAKDAIAQLEFALTALRATQK